MFSQEVVNSCINGKGLHNIDSEFSRFSNSEINFFFTFIEGSVNKSIIGNMPQIIYLGLLINYDWGYT